jgi:hypothetical protein
MTFAWPIARPAESPQYVIPRSQCLDPPYSWSVRENPMYWGQWPFPRQPWAFESETRAPGTGLISGPCQLQPVCPPKPLPIAPWCQAQWRSQWGWRR